MARTFESNFSIRNILGGSANNEQNANNMNNAPPTPPHSDGSASPDGSIDQRPGFTYSALVAMAIRSSRDKRLPLSAIQEWISENYPYYRRDQPGWQSQVRHTLSTNSYFVKIPRPMDDPGRGNYWIINPAMDIVDVSSSAGRFEFDTSNVVSTQLNNNVYGPLNQLITHGVPMNHPQAPNAVYFPTPEELGRAQCAMMMQALQEQQAWFQYHQQQYQFIQQQLVQMQHQQQMQQQYVQLQQQLLFHQRQCEFLTAKQFPL